MSRINVQRGPNGDVTVPRSQLIDALGVEHPAAGADPRIVSLVPSITELLFDLGLGSHVVGRTTFCIHPRAAVAAVPRVGGTKTVRLDKLRALAPTHVVLNVDENTREAAEAIAAFVPHVIVTHPLGPRDNLHLYRLLGGIFGRARRAERYCGEFERALEALTERVRDLPRRRVLYLIWRRPWMSISRATYISRTLALVHWETVPDGGTERYPQVTLDATLLARTDIILFSSEPFPFKDKHMGEVRRTAPVARHTLALIDGEMTSWYGTRAIKGLRYLARFAPALLEAHGSR